ncbi:MAG TPA: AMP-binding protein [Burkholderiales bacterium]|jgi:long-chain acyl-CoA synthetase
MRDALRRKTAPGLLAERARQSPQAVAYRAKKLGIYRERTWRQYAALVGRVADGLAKLGLARGERAAIIGDSCEEWVLADLAAQTLGAVTYGIYPTASAAETEYQLRDGGACIVVAENQEYVDKVLPIMDRLPQVRQIVVIDTRAMFAYRHEKLTSFAAVLDSGVADDEAAIARLEALAGELAPDGPAFVIYTSGTTGHPKGALCSHGRHLAGTYNIVEHYPLLAELQRTVVYLPLSHGLGRDIAITLPLMSGLVPHFGEDVEDLGTALFEVAPTVLFTVPRYLQKFASRVLVALMDSSALKRRAYDIAMKIGRRYARERWEGRTSAIDRLLYALARALVFRPILNKLGLDELRLVICAGAPLSVETAALWQIWGVNLCEAYGQTEEVGAIISGQRGPFPRPGDVGTLAAGWELRIAESGEIQLRGDYVFEEYLGQPEATREVRGADGWLRTGDIGEWKDGQLRLLDRARDFIVTAGGKTLSPSYIENILRASPYVAEAAVFGHARKYLTALIEIDFDTVSDWARTKNIPYSGFTSLARHPEVEALLKSEIERANAQLARVEQIKAFRILPKALDPEEEGEPITPTRKVKRQLMYERFKDLVESMYDRSEEELLARQTGTLLQH